MKFVLVILTLLFTQNMFAAPHPTPAPIVGQMPVKSSVYLVTLTKQADGFYTAIRTPLCTIKYTADVVDLRDIEMPMGKINSGTCTVTVDHKDLTLELSSMVYIHKELIHNDENPTSFKAYETSLQIRSKNQTATEYPVVPGGSAQVRDINYAGSMILHLGADSTITCDNNQNCEMQNPTKIDATVEFGTP